MCSCIAEINALLFRHNTAILANTIGTPRASIATCQLDAGTPFAPTALLAAYCPFCGESYDATPRAVPFHRDGIPGDLVDEDITF